MTVSASEDIHFDPYDVELVIERCLDPLAGAGRFDGAATASNCPSHRNET